MNKEKSANNKGFIKLSLVVFFVVLIVSYAKHEKSVNYGKNTRLGEGYTADSLKKIEKMIILSRSGKSGEVNNLNARKMTIYHFWASWCSPCIEEIPKILKYSQKVENIDKNFFLVAVRDDLMKIKKIISKDHMILSNVTVGLDSTGEISESFGTYKLPETYIVNESGKLIKKHIGPDAWE